MMDLNSQILKENSLANKKQFYLLKVRNIKEYSVDTLILSGKTVEDIKKETETALFFLLEMIIHLLNLNV